MEPLTSCDVILYCFVIAKLLIVQNVPVGFQSIRCKVRLGAKDGTNQKLMAKLQEAAERCCVVQQTLRSPPSIDTTFEVLL